MRASTRSKNGTGKTVYKEIGLVLQPDKTIRIFLERGGQTLSEQQHPALYRDLLE